MRWFFGQGEVQPVWGTKVGRLVVLFAWLHATKRTPLVGTLNERETMLQHYAREYIDISKGGGKLKLEA